MSLTVIVKKNRTHGSKMSFYEREDVSDQLSSCEEMIDKEREHLVQNKTIILSNINRLKNILEKDDSLIVKGKKKDYLNKENHRIAEELRRHIPPMHIQKTSPKDTNAFEKAVTASMHASAPEVVNLAHRYKDNSRKLEPENPYAGSIEELVGE